MIQKHILLTSALLAVTAFGVGGSQAQTLGGLIGDKGSDSLVTLGSADAGDSGAVNVGLGGESLADVNLGSGSDNLGDVNISSDDGQGLADVGVDLGDDVTARAGLAGDDGLAVLDTGFGDTLGAGAAVGGDNLLDLDFGVDSTGGAGGSGTGGGVGVGVAALGNGADGSGAAAVGAGCDSGISSSQASKLIRSGDYSARSVSSWSGASSVELTRVAMCPQMRAQVEAALSRSGLAGQIQQAALGDSLVSASLSRTHYDAGDVLAIRHSGSKLIVYVY
jgi:hypothetical protein